jgi:exodeoxyribonuclease VII small subunit
MSNSKPKTFESSLEELERIVRELEQGELTLEKSLELFERGVKLSRECQERLSQAERRIEMLTRDNQGRAIVTAFEPERELSASTSDDDDSL